MEFPFSSKSHLKKDITEINAFWSGPQKTDAADQNSGYF